MPWREENDVIYFSVTSDGTTGEDWIMRLEDNGFRIVDDAKQALRSPDFMPTNSMVVGVTIEIVVFRGALFVDNDRTADKICAEVDKCKKPNAEVACLIREKITDEEIEAMGLQCIITMHEPIRVDVSGCPLRLASDRRNRGRWLSACDDWPGNKFDRDDGFAFRRS